MSSVMSTIVKIVLLGHPVKVAFVTTWFGALVALEAPSHGQLLRAIAIFESILLVAFAVAFLRRHTTLAAKDPMRLSPEIVVAASMTISLAALQVFLSQLARWNQPVPWFGAPLQVTWMSFGLLWFLVRAQVETRSFRRVRHYGIDGV